MVFLGFRYSSSKYGETMIMKQTMAAAAVFLLSGCATKQDFVLFQGEPAPQEKTLAAPALIEYKIAPRDRLSIRVFKHPELSTRVDANNITAEKGFPVSSDGTVQLALVGRVQVGGLTKEEATERITREYARFIKNPDITVEILNQRIYVVGEVNKPGVIPLANESMTLVEAIAQAGDFNVYSQRSSVKVLRGDLRNPTVSSIDMARLASLSTHDLMLYPGDVVYVEPNKMRATNVNINEYIPALQLINNLISPFVNIKYLTEE